MSLTTNLQSINQQAIGIFDSGVGGLSIAKCITQQLPNEHIVYVADNLHAPYGDKPQQWIEQRINIIAQHLIKQNIKALVIACNTATVNAIDQLRDKVNIPIIGVEPAIKPAALISKTKKVAVLTTFATARNQRFLSLVEQYRKNIDVMIQPCPGLVELIESGKENSATCKELLKQYLQPLLNNNIDTLVLGCTHYPFVESQIKRVVGNKISIMETAQPVTEQLIRQLNKYKLTAPDNQVGLHTFFSTENSPTIESVYSTLWQQPIKLHSIQL